MNETWKASCSCGMVSFAKTNRDAAAWGHHHIDIHKEVGTVPPYSVTYSEIYFETNPDGSLSGLPTQAEIDRATASIMESNERLKGASDA